MTDNVVVSLVSDTIINIIFPSEWSFWQRNEWYVSRQEWLVENSIPFRYRCPPRDTVFYELTFERPEEAILFSMIAS